MQQHIPSWVQDAVFYQVFPDRFAKCSPEKEEGFARWGSSPDNQVFQGGNLKGIEGKLDYLQDLGIDALYLNPLFYAGSVHRYDTWDYMMIDPRLGTIEDFRDLVRNVHGRDMRLILDGVFNHTGIGFFAFQDIVKNGESSRYKEWYHTRDIRKNGNGYDFDYDCWWGYPDLPKLNIYNPDTREYLLNVASFWISQGADGWRLDVPNEIPDILFWQRFAEECIRINPEAYIVSELWRKDFPFVKERNMHGEMEYEIAYALHGFFSGSKINWESVIQTGFENKIPVIDARHFSDWLNYIFREQSGLEWEIAKSSLNLLGSHDTPRIATLDDCLNTRSMLYLALMTLPGAPMIYYGDEIGLKGGKDPDNRGAYPWDNIGEDGIYLREKIKGYVRLRKKHPSLRRGTFTVLYAEGDVIVWKREYEGEITIAGFNRGEKTAKIQTGSGIQLNDVLSDIESTSDTLNIPGKSGVVFSNR